jgi:hypothetical protein
MDEKFRKSVPNSSINANVFSRIFLCYISPLLALGKKRPLTANDLPDPCQSDECKYLTEELEKQWTKELQKKLPNLAIAVFRIYWPRTLFLTFVLAIEVDTIAI